MSTKRLTACFCTVLAGAALALLDGAANIRQLEALFERAAR